MIGLAATMALGRLLTPKDYGVLAMVSVMTGFIAVFKDGGLSLATVQRAEVNEAQVSTLFWINIGLGCVGALIVALLSPVVAWFYGDPALVNVTLAMALPFALGSATVQHQALLQRQMRFKTIAAIEIASLVISAGAGIWAAAEGLGYWALVLMSIVFSFVNVGFVLFCCQWKPGRPVQGSGVRSMLKFGGALTANNLLHTVGGSADKLLLGKFFSADALGLYTRAQTLMLQPLIQFMPALRNVMFPVMSRLAESPEVLKKTFLNMLRATAFGCSFLAVYIVMGADGLVQVFLGPQWHNAAGILRLLAGPAFFIPLSSICVVILMVRGESRALVRWGFWNNVLIIGAIVAGIAWGPAGVALALSLTSVCVLAPLLCAITAKAGPASLAEIWRAAGPGVVSLVCGCVVYLVLHPRLMVVAPFLGLAVALLADIVLHAILIGVLPAGRMAFADAIKIVSHLRAVAPVKSQRASE